MNYLQRAKSVSAKLDNVYADIEDAMKESDDIREKFKDGEFDIHELSIEAELNDRKIGALSGQLAGWSVRLQALMNQHKLEQILSESNVATPNHLTQPNSDPKQTIQVPSGAVEESRVERVEGDADDQIIDFLANMPDNNGEEEEGE